MKCFIFIVYLLFLIDCCSAKRKKKVLPKGPGIHRLHVRSDISYRFATTEVNCRIVNSVSTSGEAIFRFNIPKSAFLTNFSVERNGKVFHGVIKDKELLVEEDSAEKDEKYDDNQENRPRHANSLQLPLKMNPYTIVNIKMRYQELVTKRLDAYEHVIHLNPDGVIPDLKVEVHIKEVEPVIWLKVPPIIFDRNTFVPEDAVQQFVKTKRPSKNKNMAIIKFNPSKKQQTKLNRRGLTGQFSVQYRLNQTQQAGHVEHANGFFAHFFSTKVAPAIPKDIVFILDTSGSMHGKKLTQLKDAMHNVIDSLNKEDQFNIIGFDSWIRKWKHNSLAPVTKYNIRKAKEFIEKLKARRMTDINGALSSGLNFLSNQEKIGVTTNNVSIIMFLTDGNPTEGETSRDKILKNTREANQGRYQLNTVSFGHAVDFRFLQQVAAQNGGTAHKVYEDSDASVQIQNIYNDIASPLLTDVQMSYMGHNIKTKDTTKRKFATYFGGSEIIVCGQLKRHSLSTVVHPCVRAKASNDTISWCKADQDDWTLATQYTLENAGDLLERLWAYMSIRQLSTDYLSEEYQEKIAATKKKLLQLSLKYNFLNEQTVLNLSDFDGNNVNILLLDTDELNSKPQSKLRGRGWQDKVRDPNKRRRWKRPKSYRLKGRNKKQRLRQKSAQMLNPRTLSKIPVVAAKTLDGAVLCLPWSREAPPAWYKILIDRGLLVRALVQQYDGKAYLAAADIMAPNIRVYVSQYAIRVNSKSTRWGQPLRDAGVTVTEEKVMMEPFDGLSLEIHRVASDAPTGANLLLVLGETASLTGRQTGLLAQVKSWTIQHNSVVLPQSPPVSVPVTGPYSIGVGQVTCLKPNKDIFQLLGKNPASYKF